MSEVLQLIVLATSSLILGFAICRMVMRPDKIERKLQEHYVRKEQYEERVQIQQKLEVQISSIREQLLDAHSENSALRTQVEYKDEKLKEQQQLFLTLQDSAKDQFKLIANELLEEKSQKFTIHNQNQIEQILHPLRERIKDFEKGINQKFVEDAKDKGALREAIKGLQEMNTKMGQEANRLVTALKGDNKTQGDWGEYQLEQILEYAGLNKGMHYKTQGSYTSEQGKAQRPDFIIELPDNRQLIIDSKVSLKAYERHINAETKPIRAESLKAHINSIKNHIKGLSNKDYQRLDGINTLDYVLLFIPIEPALHLALKESSDLYKNALEKNVVLVAPSTLLATMRTVSFIWKKEKQEKNAKEIARQSGLLYDKFVGFLNDMKQIGDQLRRTQQSYEGAMNKLQESSKKRDTILGRAEYIRELGAENTKTIPTSLNTDHLRSTK